MIWWGRYVGVPFVDMGRAIEGLDCWGLIKIIYAEQLGIDLPDYGEISANDLLRVARAMKNGQERWEAVDKPQEFDLVALRLYDRGWVGHVGVMVDGKRMLHTESTIEASVVPLDHFTVRDRVAGFRRLRSTTKGR